MYTILDLCLLCLENNNNLKTIVSEDCDGVPIEEKLRSFLFEFATIKPDISKHNRICLRCLEKLNDITNYKQQCIKNIIKLNSYVHLLNDSTEPCKNVPVTSINFQNLKENLATRNNEIHTDTVVKTLDNQLQENNFGTNVITKKEPFELDSKETELEEPDERISTAEVDVQILEENIVKIEREIADYDANEKEENYFGAKQGAMNVDDGEMKYQNFEEIIIKEEDVYDETEANNRNEFPNETSNAGYNYPSTSTYGDYPSTSNGAVPNHSPGSSNENVNIQKISTDLKRTCCYYCKELVIKLPRHLLRKHSNEEKVKEFKSLPLKSRERAEIISELRNKGNFYYNHECLSKQTGTLIVKRRPATSQQGSEFLPCSHCLGFYPKRRLFMHVKRCAKDAQMGARVIKNAETLLPENPAGSHNLHTKILPELREDEIGKAVLSDNLILRLGSDLTKKVTPTYLSSSYIRQRMRELGRLLLEIKRNEPSITCLEEIFRPEYCNTLLLAIENLVMFSAETGGTGIPFTVNKIRSSILMCAQLLRSTAIKNDDEEEKACLEEFIKVVRGDPKKL